jgi:hypothetical protein
MKLLGMRLEVNRTSAESSGWKATVRNAAAIVQKDIKKNVSRVVVPTDYGPTENARPVADIEKGEAPEQTQVQAFGTQLEGGAQEMGDRASAASRATDPTKINEGDLASSDHQRDQATA